MSLRMVERGDASAPSVPLARRVPAIWLALVALMLGVAGCGDGDSNDESAPGDVRDSVEESAFTVQLRPVGVTGVTGEANIREVGRTVRVEVQHDDEEAGSLPAHIHAGTCRSSAAPIAYDLKDARDLPVRTILDVQSDALREMGSFVIHLHAQDDEDGPPIACGDVTYPPTQVPERAG